MTIIYVSVKVIERISKVKLLSKHLLSKAYRDSNLHTDVVDIFIILFKLITT